MGTKIFSCYFTSITLFIIETPITLNRSFSLDLPDTSTPIRPPSTQRIQTRKLFLKDTTEQATPNERLSLCELQDISISNVNHSPYVVQDDTSINNVVKEDPYEKILKGMFNSNFKFVTVK